MAELVDEDRLDEVPEGIAAIYSCKAGQKSYYDKKRELAIFFDHVIRAWTGEHAKGEAVTLESFLEQVKVNTKMDVNKTYGGNAGPGGAPPAYPKSAAAAVLAHYPLKNFPSPQLAENAVMTDSLSCRAPWGRTQSAPTVPILEGRPLRSIKCFCLYVLCFRSHFLLEPAERTCRTGIVTTVDHSDMRGLDTA